MSSIQGNSTEKTRFESILENKITLICCIALFFLSYIFQRYFTDLDEYFISNILRNELMKTFSDPFWLVLFWGTVAIFFLSFVVYFVFSNKRSKALALLAIVVLGALFIGDSLKIVFQLARPPQEFSAWVPEFYNNFIPTTSETHDFPAQSVLVPAAIAVYFYLRKPEKWKGLIFFIYVGLMFFARPYIGVNHISASVSGAILGIYIGFVIYKYGDTVREMSIFNKKWKKLVIAVVIFASMFIIYTLERPVFYSKPSQGVDLDIRMFMIVLGGFIGVALNGPKELSFEFENITQKIRFIASILICYIVMFAIYLSALLVPVSLFFVGIILGFIAGLWISMAAPKLVEYVNKNAIK